MVREKVKEPFYKISYNTWLLNKNKEHIGEREQNPESSNALGDNNINKEGNNISRKYWLFSPGQKAVMCK